MRLLEKKSSKAFHKAMAFVLSLALGLSAVAVSPSADAASKKAPALNAKKKTLYYNKSGANAYTLKVKKNKVKAIKKTTWKTSNKSVVKISKKKKSSVKLTAKKAGKATITAKVNYTLKGSKKIRKAALKCKITSKVWGGGATDVTPAPTAVASGTPGGVVPGVTPGSSADVSAAPTGSANVTPVPTGSADVSPAPTGSADVSPMPTSSADVSPLPTQTTAPVVKEIVLSAEKASLGVAEGVNTITLTADVKDENGNVLDGQSIKWASDKEEVATVDEKGVVTGVAEGSANITAAVGSVSSKACVITVDATVPVIEKAEIKDYKTIIIDFAEAVKGDAKVAVFKDAAETPLAGAKAELAENGLSLTISHSTAFAAGEYKIEITGVTDLAGNPMAEDASVTVEKEASVAAKFVTETTKAPIKGDGSVVVYYTVWDQYGQKMDYAAGSVVATAKIADTGYPLVVAVTNNGTAKGVVNLSADEALTEGKKVVISLKNERKDGETVVYSYSNDIETTLVSNEGLGDAASIKDIAAESEYMMAAETGDSSKVEYALTGDSANNTFDLTATLLDQYLYEATTRTDVKYVIDNTEVLQFASPDDAENTGLVTSSEAVTVNALKAGTANIKAYLVADTTKSVSIQVTIKPAALGSISVSALSDAHNGNAASSNVSLSPAVTGLKAADLKYVITSGKDVCDKFEIKEEDSNIKVYVTAKTNAKTNEIKFRVYYGTLKAGKTDEVETGGQISPEITYESTPSQVVKSITVAPFDANEITKNGTAKTEYVVLNDKGEDITASAGVTAASANTDVATVAAVTEKGKIAVTGVAEGTTDVTVKSAETVTITGTVAINVAAEAYAKEIKLEKASVSVIDKDAVGTFVKISAKDQYDNPYKITAAKYAAEVTETATDLTVGLYKADRTQASGYAAASGSDEVAALMITSNLSVTKDTAKEVKLTSASDPAKFSEVKLAVTVTEARKVASMAFAEASVVAVKGADGVNKLSLVDQYGDVIQSSAVKYAFKAANGTVTEVTASTAVRIAASAYDSTNKAYPLTAKATESGTYTVYAYVDDNAATANYDSKDTQASFTLTAGAATSLIKSIKIDTHVNGKDINTVDYIKVAANGGTATELVLAYKAYDADGKQIALGDTDLSSVLVWSAEGSDATVTVADGTITAKTAEGKSTGKVTVTLQYTPGEDVVDTIIIPVSSAAPAAKAGTYTIYKSDDTDKTDLKNGSTAIAQGSPLEFTVEAKDQYGDVIVIDTAEFYSIVSTNEDFASVEFQDDTITVTRNTTDNGKATIKVYVTSSLVYTITVKGTENKKIDLTSSNCVGQGYGETPDVAVENGVATVTHTGFNQGIKVTVTLPEDAALKDFSAISFKAKAVTKKVALGVASNSILFELQKSGETYLQGPASGKNVTIGSLAENNEISPDYVRTITLPFNWSDAENLKDDPTTKGATVTFVLGIKGKGNTNTDGDDSGPTSYTISDLTLLG